MNELLRIVRLFMSKKAQTTLALIFITGLIYVLCCLDSLTGAKALIWGPDALTLIRWGAKQNGLIAQGEVFRLIAPIFLHGNLIHFVVNMFMLSYMGPLLEIMVGRRWFLWIYFLSGISGCLWSFALLDSLSVGASGALFGVIFAIYTLQKSQAEFLKSKSIQIEAKAFKQFIFLNIFINIIFGFIMPLIDWAGHLGGAFCGTIIGYSLALKQKEQLLALFREKLIPQSIRPKYPILLLFIITIVIIIKGLLISPLEKIYGSAMKDASLNETIPLKNNQLDLYKEQIRYNNKETDPYRLLSLAYTLHENKNFSVASELYEILKILYISKLGEEEFQKRETLILINSNQIACQKHRLPQFPLPITSLDNYSYFLEQGGNFFMSLGFFNLAYHYYKALIFLDPSNKKIIQRTFEDLIKDNNYREIKSLTNLLSKT